MRKLFLSLAALCATIGITLAAPVTLVSFDEAKKEVKVNEAKKGEDAKEVTYTITDKTTFKMGDEELSSDKAMKRLSSPKAAGKTRFEMMANDKKELTEVKFYAPKKKDAK